ncbi:IAP repeat-containing protein 3 [Seminavis robusta]|uniref:IAP repeat-containing protein 3 n=1 Tax=Seminavis robusta TaxID=568900 RepID=A0A9N8ECA5_9STRA|nr:IAP repeat-containing protein 3 [Seminavis robusta]|eukprot:Sro746_g196420.1 IAP repeat-containing protein 3 (216) ;mRNA; r:28264-28911
MGLFDKNTNTHPNLSKLQDVKRTLTYHGWEIDFRDALDAHKERDYSVDFPKALRKLKVKQKLHEKDRSHPRLVALDAIVVKGLTYPGWEADVRQLETMHCEIPYIARSDIAFNNKLRGLEFSQQMYEQTGTVESTTAAESFGITATIEEPTSSRSDKTHGPFGACVICGDEARSHAFVPCGHLCACRECSPKVMRRDRRCPVCRGSCAGTVQIYL